MMTDINFWFQWNVTSRVFGRSVVVYEPVLSGFVILSYPWHQGWLRKELRPEQKASNAHHSGAQLPGL